jgi:hypothetical protein
MFRPLHDDGFLPREHPGRIQIERDLFCANWRSRILGGAPEKQAFAKSKRARGKCLFVEG